MLVGRSACENGVEREERRGEEMSEEAVASKGDFDRGSNSKQLAPRGGLCTCTDHEDWR